MMRFRTLKFSVVIVILAVLCICAACQSEDVPDLSSQAISSASQNETSEMLSSGSSDESYKEESTVNSGESSEGESQAESGENTPSTPPETSAEASSEAPDDNSSEAPNDNSSEAPDDNSSEAPDDNSSEVPDDNSSEAPNDKPDSLPHGTLHTYPSVENRAVWYRSTEKTEKEIRDTVAVMAKQNINTVYLETWYNGMFIGDTTGLPLIKHHPNNEGIDALEAFCRIGHENGIEIHAWVENFYIGLDSFDLPKATVGHHLLDRFGGNTCSTVYGNFVFLNPYDQYSQNLVKSVYEQILTKYDVDGINLDYIRFPEPGGKNGSDFGYNDDIIAAFRKEYKTDADPKNMPQNGTEWENWCAFRADIISDWVEEMFNFTQKLRPGICVSAAVDPDYPNCIKSRMQDYIKWVKNGWVDEIFTMSYTSDTSALISAVKRFLLLTEGNCFYTVGISGGNGNDTIKSQILAARNGGACGVNIFSYGDIKNKGGSFDNVYKAVWQVPSVRTDGMNKTIQAYAEELRYELLAVYAYESDVDNKYLQELNKIAKELIKQADALADNASLSAKKSYCESAIALLNGLINKIDECSDAEIREKLKNDAEFISSCLTTSSKRIRAKIAAVR